MEYLQALLDSSEIPVITAFLLGLLTAISPCPLATNITAIGFIGKDISNRDLIFANGILYAVGRILAYAVLGAILIAILRKGADMFVIQKSIRQWGEVALAPALIATSLFMLFGHKLQLSKFGFSATEKTENLRGAWGSLLLGILFALAFAITSRSLLLLAGSAPPPSLTATASSRPIFVKIFPFAASFFSFLCLMLANFECPDMVYSPLFSFSH